ncbi:MAG TPA: YoaK family protein [Pseudonocardia sp.]|jgi:uncharacterized membrane protein YoaK (UPF0700 family)
MTILRDAWRTVVPERGARHGPLPPVLLALTVVTGLVDAVSYLALGHVFVANMTGNVVFIAFSLAGAPEFSLIASALALVSFVGGAVLGGRIGHRYTHRGRRLLVLLAAQAVFVTAGYLVAVFASGLGDGPARYVLIVLLGLGMGNQNAGARSLAVPELTTTVLTMTITGASADAGWLGGPGSKLGRRLTSALAMFFGALVGALLVLHVSVSLALLVIVVMVLGLTGAAIGLARSTQGWTQPV